MFESKAEERARNLLALIEFFVGPLDADWTFAQRLRRFAMVCVSLYAGWWTAIFLAQLGLGPSGGFFAGPMSPLGAIFWLFSLVFILLWWFALAAIGFGITYFLLNSVASVRSRLILYVVVLIVAPLPAYLMNLSAKPRVAKAPTAAPLPPPAAVPDALPEAAPPPERDAATEARFEAVKKLELRRAELVDQRNARWRADITAAGASGAAGTAPRWLEIAQSPSGLAVTNRHTKPVCVLVRRVIVKPAGTERCVMSSNSCREIAPSATNRYQDFQSSGAECRAAPAEILVGSAERPEPTWWSDTALADYDANPPKVSGQGFAFDGSKFVQRMDELEKEIAALEKGLADTSRAARWRRELQR